MNGFLKGLSAAHAAGIVHRDLKPENVLIIGDEKIPTAVKILDFGLAKLASQEVSATSNPETPITSPGAVLGTFGYMSPEQLTGSGVDERSDLFSVGVMVVEALTGHRPFNGKTYSELLTNVLRQPFHLEHLSPELKHLDEVLQRCLAKDPAQRFASAAEMQRVLVPAIRKCQTIISTLVAGPVDSTVVDRIESPQSLDSFSLPETIKGS